MGALQTCQPHPPKPETTLALIFGASKWPDCRRFEPLPSVEASSDAIYDLLRRADGLDLPPRNVKNLFGSFEDAAEQLSQASSFIEFRRQEMLERGSRLTDLVIYYSGHGDFEGEAHDFYLTVRRTHSNHPMLTSITARELGNWVRRNAFDLRTYLMIDCCFAAAVQYGFMTTPLSLAELKLHEALPAPGHQVPLDAVASAGVALLAASGLNTPAIASPDETLTRFTAALLGVLEAGHPHLPEFLSLSNVHSLLSAKLITSYPDGTRPELRSLQQTHGRVELAGLFPNVARRQELAERDRVERNALEAAEQEKRERLQNERERLERKAHGEAERVRQQDERERLEQNALAAAEQGKRQEIERDRLNVERRGLLARLRKRQRQLEEADQPREAASEFAPESDILISADDAVPGASPNQRLTNKAIFKEYKELIVSAGLLLILTAVVISWVDTWNSYGSGNYLVPSENSSSTSIASTSSLYELVRRLLDLKISGEEQIWRPDTCDSVAEFRVQMRDQQIFWWNMPYLLPPETVTSVQQSHFTTRNTGGVVITYDLSGGNSGVPVFLRRTVRGEGTVMLVRCSLSR